MVIMISEIIIYNLLQFFHCFGSSTSDICFDNRPEVKIQDRISVTDQGISTLATLFEELFSNGTMQNRFLNLDNFFIYLAYDDLMVGISDGTNCF